MKGTIAENYTSPKHGVTTLVPRCSDWKYPGKVALVEIAESEMLAHCERWSISPSVLCPVWSSDCGYLNSCKHKLCFSLAFYFNLNSRKSSALPNRSVQPCLSHCFPSGLQLQIFLPPYGPNPIIATAERGVFAHSPRSSFAQKLHALVAVGQSSG